MGKFNKTLSHQQENLVKMAMIARQAAARVLARKCLPVNAKKPCRNPENLISAGLPTGDHNALKSKTGLLAHIHTSCLKRSAIYMLSVGGEKLSVHLARQLQNIYEHCFLPTRASMGFTSQS